MNEEKGVDLENSDLKFLGFSNDVNGNSIAKFKASGERAFSIQTNKPQLQKTHELRSKKPDELTKDELKTIEKEVTDFIENYGTQKQKKQIKEQSNYYKSELDKIDVNSEYPPKIKITGGKGGETKNIDINEESAKTLIKWLEENFT